MNVTKVEPGNPPDRSGWLTLGRPLQFAHRAGAVIQKMYFHWEPDETAFALSAHRGESTLFLRNLQAVRTSEYLRIGNPADEFHRLDVYETESNDAGFYQLSPLQRVGQVQLEASAEDRRVVVNFQPDFSLPLNQVDFVFKRDQSPDSAEDNYA